MKTPKTSARKRVARSLRAVDMQRETTYACATHAKMEINEAQTRYMADNNGGAIACIESAILWLKTAKKKLHIKPKDGV